MANRANESRSAGKPATINTIPATRRAAVPGSGDRQCQRVIHQGTTPATKPGASSRKTRDPAIAVMRRISGDYCIRANGSPPPFKPRCDFARRGRKGLGHPKGNGLLLRAGTAHHLHISDTHMAMLGIVFLHSSVIGHILGVFFHVVSC